MTVLSTTPATVAQASTEDITWGVDVANLLTGAQTVTAASATLTRAGVAVVLGDLAVVAGAIIQQRIGVGKLARGEYRLTTRFTPSGTTNVLEQDLTIICPR